MIVGVDGGIALVHWTDASNIYITATTADIRLRVAEDLASVDAAKDDVSLKQYEVWDTLNIKNPELKRLSALYVALWIIEMFSFGYTPHEISSMPLLFHGKKGIKFYDYIVQRWIGSRLAVVEE